MLPRLDLGFDVGGTRCAAWLYRPEPGDAPPPVVVMAHGFSGTREVRLPAYAECFAAHGLAAFVFDYRHFGASGGEPRQLLSVRRQLADWRAAVAAARALPEVDGARVGLWGTSFGGGHALVTAAGDPRVRAVVAQVPHVDGRASLSGLADLRFAARAVGAGLRDLVHAVLGCAPFTVPVVGPPGRFACLATPDSDAGFRALVPDDTLWRNEVAARVLLTLASYRPIARAAEIACPVLVVGARRDRLIPFAAIERLVAAAPRATLEAVDAEHFEVYAGAHFERLAPLEARFLAEHLSNGAAREGA
ncbi:MAG TPA: alpha/beta fold hydrolase [Myxococcota bacterium]|nr:alpha/beta fold hydrolase [Myxococcota bacterium]